MNITNSFLTVLHNNQITGTVAAVIIIILAGYFLTLQGIFTSELEHQLTKLILTLSVPALSFIAFLQPLDTHLLREGVIIIMWGFILYIGLLFITPWLYPFVHQQSQRRVFGIITTFGSTTIFGLPIAGAIYGAKGIVCASLFNIAYRILLYTYVYMVMAHRQLKQGTIRKIFVNPIVIATLLGLCCWLLQNEAPQILVNHQSVAFYRIDLTAPWLYRPLKYLADLTAPLSWLIIGCTLGNLPFKQIILDKIAWYYAVVKSVLVPLFCLLILLLGQHMHLLAISTTAIATATLLMTSPTSTIPVAYSINYHNFPKTTAKCSIVSNISSIIILPFWITVLNMIK